MPALNEFLRQDMHTPVTLAQSLEDLETLFPAAPELETDVPAGLSLPNPLEQ
ncbi:MAG: hypothetical protein ABW158_11010 [Candidatus Thiodiazotropha sp. 6PDIVS]